MSISDFSKYREQERIFSIINVEWNLCLGNLLQYCNCKGGEREGINKVIEEAILEAERKGAKVVSLGLMNQGEELNAHGGLFVAKYPKLKVKVVDGTSLATAVVLNSVPQGTTQVFLTGTLTKVASAVAFALCQKGIQVISYISIPDDYNRICLKGVWILSITLYAKESVVLHGCSARERIWTCLKCGRNAHTIKKRKCLKKGKKYFFFVILQLWLFDSN